MKWGLAIILSFLMSAAAAKMIEVSPTGKLSSIRKAVALANAGDTIMIMRGLYYTNNIRIHKPLTLIGKDNPVLHGAGKYEILTITGKNIRVSGIHFMHSGYSSVTDMAAITMVDASDVEITGNQFTQTFFGIHVANSQQFLIRNNIFKGVTKTEQTTGNGIHLWKCSGAVVEGNTSSGHRDGIYFEFVTNSKIRNNVSHHNIRYGLHFMFSNDNVYSGNEFAYNGAGVAVMFSRNVTMEQNRFHDNWGAAAYGLLLKEISDSRILGNTFLRNTVGVYMEGANRIEVARNTFSQNGWAARVQASCSDNSFNQNNFLSNTFDIATNGTMVLNQFTENYWDKYEGYDLNRDGIGDVPYHPVSLYSMLIEQNSNSLMLLRSFMVSLLDKAEKAIPSLTPANLNDQRPKMKKLNL